MRNVLIISQNWKRQRIIQINGKQPNLAVDDL